MAEFALPAAARAVPDKLARVRQPTASFGDLVHERWHAEKNPANEAARDRCESTRALFQEEHGKIVDAYWSHIEAAGVALCCKPLRRGRREWSLHYSVGSLAAGRPQYSPLLQRVARQSVHASNVLRGMPQRMATANLFALSRDIMVSLETRSPDSGALEAYRRGLQEISATACEAGRRAAQGVYLKGLLCGLAAIAGLAPLLALLFSSVSVPDVDATLFVGCLVAGSLGAAMSVLMRMSSDRLQVSHEFGREDLANLGAARAFIGAVFALLLYFAFKGNLLQQVNVPDHGAGEFAFFVTSGFVIGFSERFAKEIVRAAESGAAGTRRRADEEPEAGQTAKRT